MVTPIFVKYLFLSKIKKGMLSRFIDTFTYFFNARGRVKERLLASSHNAYQGCMTRKMTVVYVCGDEEVFSEGMFSFKSSTRYISQNGGYTIKRDGPDCLDSKARTSTWHSPGCSVQSSNAKKKQTNKKKPSQQNREIKIHNVNPR